MRLLTIHSRLFKGRVFKVGLCVFVYENAGKIDVQRKKKMYINICMYNQSVNFEIIIM